MDSLQTFAEAKLDALESQPLRWRLSPTHRLGGLWVERRLARGVQLFVRH